MHPFVATDIDPKAKWALNHLDFFPVEISKASLEELLRVPGIGAKGARMIIKARRTHSLGEGELKKLGIAYKRARFFITCNGRYRGSGIEFSREGLHAMLAAPINGGRHGRRADKALPGQLSLFGNELQNMQHPCTLQSQTSNSLLGRSLNSASQAKVAP